MMWWILFFIFIILPVLYSDEIAEFLIDDTQYEGDIIITSSTDYDTVDEELIEMEEIIIDEPIDFEEQMKKDCIRMGMTC
ncbi:hypothetical protein LCGC14_1470010 [marine sediment metagenome]|uniref:Uncharacterized protein n=1 Tax=marine sediment metagenome TaxID=412755 RepID=A0A0F9JCK1_9ZZZZ